MIEDVTKTESTTKYHGAKRPVVFETKLPSKYTQAPRGISMRVTSTPHRSGKEGELFHEAWFVWEGNSFRSSAVIHDRVARDALLDMLEDITGINHEEEVTEILARYEWSEQ